MYSMTGCLITRPSSAIGNQQALLQQIPVKTCMVLEDLKILLRFPFIILFYALEVGNHKPPAKFRILIQESRAVIDRKWQVWRENTSRYQHDSRTIVQSLGEIRFCKNAGIYCTILQSYDTGWIVQVDNINIVSCQVSQSQRTGNSVSSDRCSLKPSGLLDRKHSSPFHFHRDLAAP